MTYNPPFLYRCQYDDGQFIERQTIFGETDMERFYIACCEQAQRIKGATVRVEYYDRRHRKWKPLVAYSNKGGEDNAENSARQDDFDLPAY